MSFFKWLNPVNWFASGAVDAAKGISEIVEKWAPTAEQKAELTKELERAYQAAQASARGHDQPMNSQIPVLDGLINGVNRLIRPSITIGLFGGLLGWWPLPNLEGVDALYLKFGETVLLFWFGGRAIFKDLPAAISYLKKS